MSDRFVEYVCEHLGDIEARRMFGGWGIFRSGSIVGLVHGGALYEAPLRRRRDAALSMLDAHRDTEEGPGALARQWLASALFGTVLDVTQRVTSASGGRDDIGWSPRLVASLSTTIGGVSTAKVPEVGRSCRSKA